MSEHEKPLHIQVAEAVGWTDINSMQLSPAGVQWWGKPPVGHRNLYVGDIDMSGRTVTLTPNYGTVDRYDTDWSATGPLIEDLGVSIERVFGQQRYVAMTKADKQGAFLFDGDTPLIAVCNLILALGAAGKLKAA